MKKGDRVEVIDDNISGVVMAVDQETVTIETEDGFSMRFERNELVKMGRLDIDRSELNQVVQAEKNAQREKQKNHRKHQNKKPLEVDLHIENLVASTKNMSDFDMLNHQLNTAKSQLEFAIKSHFQKVVFIHGVGKGVLRMELETLLRRYDHVEFYDANFRKYGRGATEVYIYHNR